MGLVQKVRAKTFQNQGLTFCRPGKEQQQLLTKTLLTDGGRHCPICHFRVRGSNHDQGIKHVMAAAKLKKDKR